MNKNDRNGFFPNSIRAISGYLKIVSSGASNVASTVRSAASGIADRECRVKHGQVNWAGFDKLEYDENATHQVMLLGYQSGFQVWDVEEADNVRELISRYDGPVSFMQMLPKPIASDSDKFAESRPLLVICADDTFSSAGNLKNGLAAPCNAHIQSFNDQSNVGFLPTAIWFYSFKSQSYVHVLKFRSFVYCVRCSPRVVAVLQAAQIHCFDAATLEREYTILTNPIVNSCSVSGSLGLGPLALGHRWIAYSGPPVAASNSGCASVKHLTPSASVSVPVSNESLVAHAKESSKQLAAGIVTLGDMGYKKLSRYYSERGSINCHLLVAENVGMVIVRDVVGKSVLAQFRAHKSPISSLCFDPSGTLLVSASVQGHNINVFRLMPGLSGPESDSGASYEHLYRLQRGFTNAVIQDISFSDDSHWIMVSSLRGTNHLFECSDACFTTKNSGSGAMNKFTVYGSPNSVLQMPNQQTLNLPATPITLTAVSRIRCGNNGWRSTVTGAAAAATGRMSSPSGPIASVFHNCKGKEMFEDTGSSKSNHYLLVLSPGCVIQYALRISSGISTTYQSVTECDARLLVEPIQKWNICQKQDQREEENIDIYGENRNSDSSKIFPEGVKKENSAYLATKVDISPKEKHHMYIAEAELQMHKPRSLLWDKPEIYFQSMVKDVIKIDEKDSSRQEIEIEKIPTRMVEARSKVLVPVLDFLQTSKFEQARGFVRNGSSSKLNAPA
ncbi:hypothetical protein LguiA_035587 [Lonicera macranthoides]